jgi:hypothetical protein
VTALVMAAWAARRRQAPLSPWATMAGLDYDSLVM